MFIILNASFPKKLTSYADKKAKAMKIDLTLYNFY